MNQMTITPKHGAINQTPVPPSTLVSVANKCFKQTKNKLYFQYKALSPVIFRMPITFMEPGSGVFGTDAKQVYADPMDVIQKFRQSPDELSRLYLHMLFLDWQFRPC